MKNKIGKIIIWIIVGLVLASGVALLVVGNILPNGNVLGDAIKKEVWDASKALDKFIGTKAQGNPGDENYVAAKAGTWISLVGSLFAIAIIISLCKLVRISLKKIMEKSNRAKTVVTLIDGLVKYSCALAIVFIVLSAVGVDTSAIWASVGILTLIIGLGCQSLITDIVAGLFLVAENEYNVGEIIVVDGFRGTVKEIGIRSTKILDAAGNIKIINNSDIKNIVNLSRELSLAVCDCGIDYSDSIERVELVIAHNLEKIKERIPAIVDGPYYKGVSELADSAVVIKVVAQCKEEDRYQVQRDLNREIKILFDNNNVSIPFPQVTISQYKEAEVDVSENQEKQAKSFVDEQKEISASLEQQQDY